MDRDDEFTEWAGGAWARLYRAAVLLGCRPADAEDLVQSTLTRCFLSWGRIEHASNRDAYVYRMLLNGHTSSRRRRWWGERPTEHLPERMDGRADPVADLATSDVVERALGELPAEQRAVLVLRYFAHLSEQETADALGIAVGTVKSRSSRALAALATSPQLIDDAEGGAR